jgi:hypothetical protein
MAAAHTGLTDLSQLVPLLYRADWTHLCLSAEIATLVQLPRLVRMGSDADSWQWAGQQDGDDEEANPAEAWRLASEAGDPPEEDLGDSLPRWRSVLSRIVVAPIGQYRIEDILPDRADRLAVSDGETCWRVFDGQLHRDYYVGMNSEFVELLDPSALISDFDLELTGAAEAAGRPACRVVATPRPAATGARFDRYRRFDRIEAVVDAELGILLRREAFSGARSVEFFEMRSLTLDPAEAGDPALFRPPPGLPMADDGAGPGTFFDTSGPGWRVVKAGARAAGAALTFAVRHSGGQPDPAPPAPPMPEPGQPPAGAAAPLGDDLVNLLHRTGLPAQRFATGVRKWTDGEAVLGRLAEQRAVMPFAGMLGPDALWDAIAGRQHRTPRVEFQTARFRVALPGSYRIDFLAGGWKERAWVCDGTQRWTVYHNRVVTEPTAQLRDDWARLADPAWLLSGWQLTTGGPAEVGGRRGWRVWADAKPGQARLAQAGLFGRAAVIIDAELGIVLRLSYLVGDQLAVCLELHDVTVPSAEDPGDFAVHVPPGTRLVEGSGPLAHLDIPTPLQAALTAGKAGLTGASAVAGWLQKRLGNPDDRASPP